MTMNKKETAAFEDLQRQLREAQALRFTEDVPPDLPPPENSSMLNKGWLFNSYGGSVVTKACSSSIYHSWDRDDEARSQGARALFSTELRATRALRRAKELEFAAVLAKLDQRITELKAQTSPAKKT